MGYIDREQALSHPFANGKYDHDKDIEEYTWEQNLRTLLTHIGVCDIGKERWFDQEDGRWYDRKEHDYITFREVMNRAMDTIERGWEL